MKLIGRTVNLYPSGVGYRLVEIHKTTPHTTIWSKPYKYKKTAMRGAERFAKKHNLKIIWKN